MATTVNTGWLFDKDGNKFAPKTLMSQVIDDNGNPLDEQININSYNYCECYTGGSNQDKIIPIANFDLIYGVEITVKFIYGHFISSTIRLNVNGTGAIPVFYKGVPLSYTILKENSVYTFRYSNSQYSNPHWELIGDIVKVEKLQDLGITATYEEINYLEGTAGNVQEQIDALKEHVENNYYLSDTIGTGSDQVITVFKDDSEEYLYLEAPSTGIAIMTGYLDSSKYSAIWMKINNLEVFKVQHEIANPNTYTYHKFAFKVEKGDVITGNASASPILYFHPTIKDITIT